MEICGMVVKAPGAGGYYSLKSAGLFVAAVMGFSFTLCLIGLRAGVLTWADSLPLVAGFTGAALSRVYGISYKRYRFKALIAGGVSGAGLFMLVGVLMRLFSA